jgi:hypothetical protein
MNELKLQLQKAILQLNERRLRAKIVSRVDSDEVSIITMIYTINKGDLTMPATVGLK